MCTGLLLQWVRRRETPLFSQVIVRIVKLLHSSWRKLHTSVPLKWPQEMPLPYALLLLFMFTISFATFLSLFVPLPFLVLFLSCCCWWWRCCGFGDFVLACCVRGLSPLPRSTVSCVCIFSRLAHLELFWSRTIRHLYNTLLFFSDPLLFFLATQSRLAFSRSTAVRLWSWQFFACRRARFYRATAVCERSVASELSQGDVHLSTFHGVRFAPLAN